MSAWVSKTLAPPFRRLHLAAPHSAPPACSRLLCTARPPPMYVYVVCPVYIYMHQPVRLVRLVRLGSHWRLKRLHRASRTGQMDKNRANFSTRSDTTDELDGLFGALLFFGAAQRPRSPGAGFPPAQSTQLMRPCKARIYRLFVSAIFCLLFVKIHFHLRFACSEGHSPFDPGRSPLSAGTMSHSQYHIYMTCLMEIKRKPWPPPAGADTTERIDIYIMTAIHDVDAFVGSGSSGDRRRARTRDPD
jgi:hypothetical protein